MNSHRIAEPTRHGDDGAPRRDVADPRLRYQMWVLRQMPGGDELYRQRLAALQPRHTPTISVVTPVYNTPPDILRRMLGSVQRQTYPHWQHCLVDDGSSEPWIARLLERAAAADRRIVFRRRDRNGGIVAASNDAFELATGEFVAFLDHDDELDPEALYAVAELLDERADTDVIYTDLDIIGLDGIRHSPYLWPDWSPELLLCIPYTAHLSVYRRALIEAVGALREGLDGAQDYDLILRIIEKTDRVAHIPRVLYHWRAMPGSAAASADAKPYAYRAQERAIDDYLSRNWPDARRRDGPYLGSHRIHHSRADQPPVSIVASLAESPGPSATRSLATLARSLASIARRSDYPSFEIVVVAPSDLVERARSVLADLGPIPVLVVDAAGAEDDASASNVGACQAAGALLVFLGQDLEPDTADWLAALSDFARQRPIGAVGPKVYSSDDMIEHAGIVIPRGVPHPVLRGAPRRGKDHIRNLLLPTNYLAVSGACLMTRRDVFEEVGRFRAAHDVGYSDLDYCLRLRDRGYRVVFTPYAELRCLHPSASVHEGTDVGRLAAFQRRWGAVTQRDPYYNPNFSQENGQFILALD